MTRFLAQPGLPTASLLALVTTAVLVIQAKPSAEYPPSTYSLSEVHIWVSKAVRGGSRGSRGYEVRGNGTCRLILNEFSGSKDLIAASVTVEEVRDLLNAFHAAYFFDLKTSYGHPYTVTVKADGTVQTSGIVDSHAAVTTVGVRIGNYEKHSSFEHRGPAELLALAARIERFVNSKRSAVPNEAHQ